VDAKWTDWIDRLTLMVSFAACLCIAWFGRAGLPFYFEALGIFSAFLF